MRISTRPQLVSSLALALLAAPGALAQGQPNIFNLEVAPDDPGAGDLFACAMSLSRERTLVIGSVLDDDRGTDSGSLYVYRRRGGGFEQTAKLLAGDGAPEHRLGFSVSVDPTGARLAAGAIFHDAAGEHAGAAYVFRREGGGWVEEARLIPSTVGPFDQLGHSVALDGHVLAVGAPGDDTRADAAGTVYVYEREGQVWRLAAMLTATEGQNVGDGLGFAVALDGDTLLAGAPFADDGLGAVHVFARTVEGWQEVQRITAPQRRAGALFGAAVALDGERAVIGARLDDRLGDRAGAAWVFHRVAGIWQIEQPLPTLGQAAGDEFGISVALDGDALAVGARFDDDEATGANDSGAVYRYRRRGVVWVFEQKLKAAEPAAGDELGFAVAVEDMEGEADDLVVAGAYRADSEAGPDSGLARLRVEARNADLAITKTDGRSCAGTGDTLVYTITATNSGPADVAGARVTDTFPAGLTCTWICTPGGAGASCGVASGTGPIDVPVTLAENASLTFTATCTVAPSAQGSTIFNSATIEVPDEVIELDPKDNSATDTTRIGSSFVTIDKTAPEEIEIGGQVVAMLRETVEVSNTGPCPAAPVVVTDVRRAGDPRFDCTWECTEGACGSAAGLGLLDDTIVTLPSGDTAAYVLSCAVPSDLPDGTTLTDTAIATGPDNPATDDAKTTVVRLPIEPPDVAITVIPNPVEAPEVEGRVVVANVGTAPSGPFTVTLSRDLVVAGFTVTGASCEASSSSSTTCTIGSLAAGAEVRLDIDIPADCDNPSEVELTAQATPPPGDSDPRNDQDSGTLVIPAPDACPVNLRILKGAAAPQFAQNSLAFFTVTVINDGPETAFGATVTDLLPGGLQGASWSCTASPGAACTPTGGGSIRDVVTLPPGGTVTYSLTTTVAGNACGPITNTALVKAVAPNVDTQPLDNSGSASILALPVDTTCAVKTVFPRAQLEGGEITYTILLVHGGPGTLGGPGPEFEDIVPNGLTVEGVGANRGTASFVGNTVRWDGTLDPGESVTITITAIVDTGTLGQVICNQGALIPSSVLTDDPDEPGFEDPTCLAVVAFIPTLSPALLALMALLLAAVGVIGLVRRRAGRAS